MAKVALLFVIAVATTLAAAETGICSWYGADGEIPPGHPTASGEGFDRWAMKAAHKTLPFGTKVRVINLKNKRTVDVTINDRGPFTPGRILDLTYGAFGKVAKHDDGLFDCTYEYIFKSANQNATDV